MRKNKKKTLVRWCNPWYNRVSRKGKINHNAHSVYLMYYHLIMVVRYRRKVIDNPISERAKGISISEGNRFAGAGKCPASSGKGL